MKISVITPTVREEGLNEVYKSLKRQTFKDFEWIVVSPEKPNCEFFAYGKINWKYVKDPGKKEGDYWSIYKAYNEALRNSEGELIVSWQDHTESPPDTLERFWNHYLTEPKTLVSAVGNKYSDGTYMDMTWKDPRERNDQGRYYPCNFNDIEWNLCSCPKKAIYDVGGFDEDLDKWSSLCGLDVLFRLNVIKGYDFKLDQDIKTFSTEHGRLPNWDEKTPFNGVWQSKQLSYLENPVLDYL